LKISNIGVAKPNKNIKHASGFRGMFGVIDDFIMAFCFVAFFFLILTRIPSDLSAHTFTLNTNSNLCCTLAFKVGQCTNMWNAT